MKVLPFGLKCAPAYFQWLISTKVLAGLLHVICEAYLDDVLIYADSREELDERIKMVMDRLKEYNLCVNPRKVVIGVQVIEWLGIIISQNGLRISPSKVEGLKQLESPTDKSKLRAVLGLANYFRDFVPNFSLKVVLMESLLFTKVQFHWSDEHEAEFQRLKEAVMASGIYAFSIVV